MYKSYLERGYYPLNATPIEKIIYDYKYEIEALKWHKEQLNKYKNQEMKELECLESDIEILKNTKWNESEYKKVMRKQNVNSRKTKINNIKEKIFECEQLVEEHLGYLNDLSQLMINYKDNGKDELLKELKEIRWNNSKVSSGHFTTKPNKFYKYCK